MTDTVHEAASPAPPAAPRDPARARGWLLALVLALLAAAVVAVWLDGRNARVPKHESGNFVKPTILDDVPASSELADTEIFGPVLSLVHADDLDEGLRFLERSAYGNQASLFTSSGAAARRFRYEAPAGNIGINIGVAAPMAYFPFSGWKESFFGVQHGQGRDAVEFYTEKKVVVERWAAEHSRKF